MYIMKMSPAFKDYLWGGTRLKSRYNKRSDLDILAESWEISCHPNGQSMISNGVYAGKTLDFVSKLDNGAPLGKNCRDMTKFPMLVKLIDAAMDLSIQVHPDDEFALENEGESGKTEAWVVLDCDKGSYIYFGFKNTISREELRKSISDGSVVELLNKVFVSPGDVFVITPGTVHAIGGGITLAEIQQNSDITYRLYDFDRLDASGNPRELHIDKGILCADLNPVVISNPPCGYLVSCEHFSVKKLVVNSKILLSSGDDSFKSLLVIEGEGCINSGGEALEFVKGDCFFVPTSIGEFEIDGNCEILLSHL